MTFSLEFRLQKLGQNGTIEKTVKLEKAFF